jgi:hypothetical protein
VVTPWSVGWYVQCRGSDEERKLCAFDEKPDLDEQAPRTFLSWSVKGAMRQCAGRSTSTSLTPCRIRHIHLGVGALRRSAGRLGVADATAGVAVVMMVRSLRTGRTGVAMVSCLQMIWRQEVIFWSLCFILT